VLQSATKILKNKTSINSLELPAEFQKFPVIPAGNLAHNNSQWLWSGCSVRQHIRTTRVYVKDCWHCCV